MIINLRVTGNFMLKVYVSRNELSTYLKREGEGYKLTVIDENLLNSKDSRVNREIILSSVIIQHYHEKLTFNIMSMINHSIVLNMS